MMDSTIYNLGDDNFYLVLPWIILSSITSFLACFFSVNAVKYCGASTAAMIEISYPLWVILFTWLIKGESNLNFNTLLGGFFILVGTYIVIKGE